MNSAHVQMPMLDKLLQELDTTLDLERQQEVAIFLVDSLAVRRLEVTFGRGKKNDRRADIAEDTDKVVAALLGHARWPGNEAVRETFMRTAMGQMAIQRDMGVVSLERTVPAVIELCVPTILGEAEVNLTDMLVAARPELTKENYNKVRDMAQSLALSANAAFSGAGETGLPKQGMMRAHVMHNLARLMVGGYKPTES